MLRPYSLHSRLFISMLCVIALGSMGGSFTVLAQDSAEVGEEFSRGKIIQIKSIESGMPDIPHEAQEILVTLLDGSRSGETVTIQSGVLPGREDTIFEVGETVLVNILQKSDGNAAYILREKYRFPSLLWIIAAFVLLTFILGGITGLTSLVGLFVSVLVIAFFILPQIAAGSSPLGITLIGGTLIACSSLYLAHGFNRRTSVALGSVLITLVLSTIIAVIIVHFTKLFGLGSEESVFLQAGLLQSIDLRGLLLAGLLLGCLGVLDDITTAQAAAIEEISRANPSLSAQELRRAGRSIGKEHIASLINTLALAYAGASLPLLLLLKTQESYPLWVTLNTEFFAEEIVRTIVGSTALLLAVPISTWLAASFLRGHISGTVGPLHVH